MNFLAALLTLSIFSAPAHAGFTSNSNETVTGQMGVQTFDPQAQLDVQMSSFDAYGLEVLSSTGAPLACVDSGGHVGIGTFSPQANLDIPGAGDNSTVGLWLRSGNSTMTVLSSQIVFAAAGSGAYRHSIASQHNASENLGNSLDFFLWNSTAQPAALGTQEALSLQAIDTASSVSVHVDPIGTPTVELEVSNSEVTGGGTIIRASAGTYSSRDLKWDIQYLTPEEHQRALADVTALKPVQFRYKGRTGAASGPLRRGLIYEDAPESIRGPGSTIVFDNRLANLEMTIQAIDQRIADVQSQIDLLKQAKKQKKRNHL